MKHSFLNIPPVLYHYTSEKSFLSIIENSSLWMSDIGTTNDAKERIWLLEIFDQVWADVRSSGLPHAGAGHSFHDAKLELQDALHIASFSEHRDALSQWRAYAEDGRGFSLGFRFSQTTLPLVRGNFNNFSDDDRIVIGDCLYDQNLQRKLVMEKISTWAIAHLKLESSGYRGSVHAYDAFVDEFSWEIQKMCMFFKHPGFYDEREWRVIYMPRPDRTISSGIPLRAGRKPRFSSNSKLIDYYELTFSNDFLVLSEVVLGPKCLQHFDETRRLLNASGHSNVAIYRSEIPYR